MRQEGEQNSVVQNSAVVEATGGCTDFVRSEEDVDAAEEDATQDGSGTAVHGLMEAGGGTVGRRWQVEAGLQGKVQRGRTAVRNEGCRRSARRTSLQQPGRRADVEERGDHSVDEVEMQRGRRRRRILQCRILHVSIWAAVQNRDEVVGAAG